jgi:chaperonin GroEL
MSKKIFYSNAARRTLAKGMEVLVEAVSVTLGPRGRNVVISNPYGSPQIVNDGVTIAKEIALKDNTGNTGVGLIRQAASKTNDVAGDGTTTSTVLAYAIVKEGMKNIVAGANTTELKIGIEKASTFLIKEINENAVPVESTESIIQVASISAGNDQAIGKMIAEALEKVGKNGVISLEEGNTTTTELEITEGMNFEKGFISPYFINKPERLQVVFENPYVLITDKQINLIEQELLPILEQIAPTKTPLLIIAQDIGQEALSTLVLNTIRKTITAAGVRTPAFGDLRKSILQDIAILTNATLITEDAGLTLKNVKLDLLGRARTIIIDKKSTIIVNDSTQEQVKLHCNNLRKQINLTDDKYEKEKLQNRIAKLSGGVAVIKVGAVTETEMKDKKLRLEDAINATKAAVEEGIVPGGGSTYIKLGSRLSEWAGKNLLGDELIGALIVAKAIEAPLRRIAQNSGQNGSIIIEKIRKNSNQFSYGYDALNNRFEDLYDVGIIDPAKVTRSALQNATSIAAMILTTECLIVDREIESVDNLFKK